MRQLGYALIGWFLVSTTLAGCRDDGSGGASSSSSSGGGGDGGTGPRGGPPGVVSFVGVTSDRVPDVSSLAAWQRSFITDGMSDDDKAQAIWRSVVGFRHQDEPAREFLESSTHAHDPIKLFNVYGYSQCDCASAAVLALARSVGLGARGRSLTAHSVAELWTGGAWHMFDAAYIDQFPEPSGVLAGVDELVAAVSGWLAQNPALDGSYAALENMMTNGTWRQGPALLAACPYYDAQGRFPAGVQGWADSVTDYDRDAPETEFGYTLGYRVNVQLRAGEKLVRNFGNVGHHVNDDLGVACESLTDVPGQGDMRYSPAYGDLAPGRVGNGLASWTLPLAGGEYRAGALTVENLRDAPAGGAGPAVAVKDASQPGVLVVRLPSSYVYLSGSVALTAEVAPGGRVLVELSRNNGLDWTPVATLTTSGTSTVDVSWLVRRQYDYRLRFTLSGAGTGLDAVTITDEIQHSQRALPALAQGDNHLHFGAGPDEGTITLEANTDSTVSKNLNWKDLHAVISGGVADSPLHLTSAGSITFPVATPGDLLRLRFGGFYRARETSDAWDFQVSFDGGGHFVTVEHAAGPTVGAEDFVTFDQIPPGTRSALVRYSGTVTTTLELFDFRVDADYREPSGGFAPVQITYEWTEDGVPKRDVHLGAAPDERWTIHCDRPPRLTAITVERLP